MATATRLKKKVTSGSLADAMQQIREEKRKHEEIIKELNTKLEALEAQLIEHMDLEGITKATGTLASVSISESIKANVTDWDEFYKWIFKHKYTHMLQRRPADLACREIFESKGSIPGVEPFVKRTINLRNI